jgi:hypothetical protein
MVIVPAVVHAEGTKQVRPDSTISGAALFIDQNNLNYTRFCYVGCPPNYRLYIHVKNVGEYICYGLNSPVARVKYNLKKPNGTAVVANANLPTTGAGFIKYYRQAVIGPFAANGGYTPLFYQVTSIADTGNWYFEINAIPNGADQFAGCVRFTLFDFQVVSGANWPPRPADTLNGRVWSQSWQLYAQLPNNGSHEEFNARMFVYSDDGITTKLQFNQVDIGEGTIFANPVGCYNTGNWISDRQSQNSNTFTTFPGIAWYKVFLNNPDPTVYKDGEYGTIVGDPQFIDDPNYPPCSGKKYIVVDVNKKGRVSVKIDVPYGDPSYDVFLYSEVVPGINNIPWDGLDGHGGQVPHGTVLTITVDYINGLTNIPLWDFEGNPNGYKIYPVRPIGPGLLPPLLYWDDSQLTNTANCSAAPQSVNLTGCVPSTNVCHDWPADICHDKMINTWWYTGSTSSAPLIVIYNPLPVPALTGPVKCCTDIPGNVYTTDAGNFNYLWTVSAGGTITAGGTSVSNTVTVTWNTPGPHTVSVNYTSPEGCTGESPTVLDVIVITGPVITLSGPTPLCAGATGNVYTTESGMSDYVWMVSAGGTVTSGGTPISNTVTVTWNTAGPNTVSVNYTNAQGCPAPAPAIINVLVNPLPVTSPIYHR